MDEALANLVWQRAGGRCEYCRLPQEFSATPFEIDHIIAEQHGGKTVSRNLALACFACNHHKGPNLAGIDPKTGKRAWLFDPRRHKVVAALPLGRRCPRGPHAYRAGYGSRSGN
jgi:5-methylcytosine-specific restriction endonuclease McrA